MDGTNTAGDLLRFVGFATVCVGVAWAVQVLGFGDASGIARLVWTIAAATVCGAGAGMVLASNAMDRPEAPSFG